MSAPDLSIVIPIYQRGDIIRYTLESVRRAAADLVVETIIVDDGSPTPIAGTLDRLAFVPTKLILQSNQGLLYARLTGLAAATGRYVLFLDSDDLVTADKLTAQVAAMERGKADVSYTDSSATLLAGEYDALTIIPQASSRATTDAAEFFVTIQPPPHGPMFRTAYLRSVVATAFFPPSPLYNPVAEIWFYHNAAPRPGRVVHVPGPRAIIGQHPDARLTNHWERLGVASLAIMEAFARTCPTDTLEAGRARQLVGEKAFRAWRRLPRGFSPEFCARTLAVWRKLAVEPQLSCLGGRGFQALARLFGPVAAGRLLRQLQNRPYAGSRTMNDADFDALLRTLPPP
ncbi:MAG: glycosyltransferase family 2 protein [Verrucomicrobia bacterium]|nr:glycosyltransferase family 2 protein [Verrucomicrobiota bacterium]